MAAGALVVGGVVTVVVVGVAAVTTYCFHLYDQKQEDVRRICMLNKLRDDKEFFNTVCDKVISKRFL